MIVIANVLRKLQTVKDLVRLLSKKSRFRTRFDSQHVKGSQTLLKSEWGNFYHVFSLFRGELIWKTSPLVIIQILGVFINTLTADDNYPVPDYKNLQLPIEMQLSSKQTCFFQFFVPFLDSTSNFKHFLKKRWSL